MRRYQRPEIIAHRGAPRDRPESTVAGFVHAADDGAEAVELDVHATADGTVVVHHDPVPRADAGDPALAGRPIASLTLAELRTFSVGGEPIPTLDEVLAAVGERVGVYVEIKGAGIERAVLDVLGRRPGRYAVHAFDHRVPRLVAGLARLLPVGVLSASYLLDPAATLRAAGARDYWQEWHLIDEALVDAVQSAGGRVIAWTVNDLDAARRLAAMGVDGLCSDVAGQVRRALAGGA